MLSCVSIAVLCFSGPYWDVLSFLGSSGLFGALAIAIAVALAISLALAIALAISLAITPGFSGFVRDSLWFTGVVCFLSFPGFYEL